MTLQTGTAEKSGFTGRLASYERIVVKVGSALLVDPVRGVREEWLGALADDIAELGRTGADVLVVSSGAIALGRKVLGLPRGKLKLEESQAAAATGQIALSRAWAEALGQRGLAAGQILLTLGDTEERRRYLNARATIANLLKFGAVPVVNENDTVATNEIRYGDNDRLAARVGTMVSADLVLLLSDVEGLYTAPPARDPSATMIPHVEHITPEIEAMASGAGSELSRGGMQTKIEAAKIATGAGAGLVIASGRELNPIARIDAGEPCTWFAPAGTPVAARKTWIAGTLEPRGAVTLDAGACTALRKGKSLLPAGVKRVDGSFQRGDTVAIRDEAGALLGLGLIAYDVEDARLIIGRKSHEIEDLLGYAGRSEMIHRDDMALGVAARLNDED
ncbi:glutamate 5-kinase [Tepidamorphus sp. 3E244]|uniref:glutamate 5-kinase n=1 Tax=Tepidamorphus sp. 3E244 TaxID=3385498 RepID=UPI0038FCD1A8